MRRFPQGFLWGSATSSHQVEGGNENDWSLWERVSGHIADGSVSGTACDQYARFAEDFALAASLGQNAHRMSIEWSRIEPRAGEWDMAEVMHYREVLRSLHAHGLTPVVTLWHFTLPQWFAESGGWERPDATDIFCRYAEFVVAELCDLVEIWITINEPNVYVAQSYRVGVWPPGVRSTWRMMKVFLRIASAHRKTYIAIHRSAKHKGTKIRLGVAMNLATFEPWRESSLCDRFVAWVADEFYNRVWYQLTSRAHDFIGINYYFHHRAAFSWSRGYSMHAENGRMSDVGWTVHPEKLAVVVRGVARYGLPIYITEHGVADVRDELRQTFITESLACLSEEITHGADVRGYFHWSLIDNFEWEKGFAPKFGLVAVDFATQVRQPRPSAETYAKICKENI